MKQYNNPSDDGWGTCFTIIIIILGVIILFWR